MRLETATTEHAPVFTMTSQPKPIAVRSDGDRRRSAWVRGSVAIRPHLMRISPFLESANPAGDIQRLPGGPAGIGRCEEDDGRGNVIGPSDSPQRRLRF